MLLFLSLEEHAWGERLPAVGPISLSFSPAARRRIEWLGFLEAEG